MKKKSGNKLYWAFVVVLVVLGSGAVILYTPEDMASSISSMSTKTAAEKDVYVRFAMEGYDKIKSNYWKKIGDEVLAPHFQLSLQRALNSQALPPLSTTTRDAVAVMMEQGLSTATSTSHRKQIVQTTLGVALYNLYPIGRSGLMSEVQEKTLRQSVANVDPNKDLYKDLGLETGAAADAVKRAYDARAAELKKDSSPAAEEELKRISYAKEVLTNPDTKQLYDTEKIEPTSSVRTIGKTLYIKIDKISPTTLYEFGRTVSAASTTPGLNSMIIDLRGNLGGALDFAQHFLGLFLGFNQYAFDLFQQDVYNVQRTAQAAYPPLSPYKDIVVLTDNMTQSSAEVTAAAFKRFKLGTVIGATTRGWGTVENTFPLETQMDPDEKYSLFLVHSLTIRDDGQPVESNGVVPHFDISSKTWKTDLSRQVRTKDLIQAVISVIGSR